MNMTQARAIMESGMLTDTCTIVRLGTATSDGAGGKVPATSTNIGPLACLFYEVSGDEATTEIVAVRGRYRLQLAATTDVRVTDQITVLSATYRVVWTPSPNARHMLRTVGLKEAT